MSVVIHVEHLSKSYRLGTIGGGTLRADVSRWLAKLQGKSDPNLKIGQEHHARLMGQEFWALQDVSFEVKQGEILGIVGRNGAGKSTLLKILSRVTAPTSGLVKVKGRIASLLEVGTGFHPELTGRENVFLNGAILGMSKAEIKKKFDEIIDFSGVEDFIDTPVKRYSSGMYVRLAFAVAAYLEPEILIVDEVLAVGDSEFQKKCLGKMESVSRNEGRTVIFVTHQLNSASELCSRGLLFQAGQLALDRGMDDVIAHYTGVMTNIAVGQSRMLDKIQIMDAENQSGGINCVCFGKSVQIAVDLKHLPATALGLNIGFRNEAGKLVSLFSTNPHDGVMLPKADRIRVILVLSPCCFAPGTYTLDIAITEPAIRIIEEVSCAFKFQVLGRSVGGDWAYEARFGDCFPPHSWSTSTIC